MQKVNVRGSARLFRNPVLESLTHTSPLITLLFYIPLVVTLFLIGVLYFEVPLSTGLAVFAAAIFIWSVTEYLMHRYVYHFINENKYVQRFHYLMHGVHHDYPKDESRLFLPPVPGLILASIFFTIFWLIMGKWTFVFFPGFTVGYLGYVFTHYSIHKFRRPNNFLGYIWDHHNMHHFKSPERAFGVSTPLWDFIFGTMPERKNKQG